MDKIQTPGRHPFSIPVKGGQPIEGVRLVGNQPGKTLVVTAGVHGDEYVGIQAVRELLAQLSPGELSGQVIFVPVVNAGGFFAGTYRVPEDGENLNRCFPGAKGETYTWNMASALEAALYPQADFLVGGSVDLYGSLAEAGAFVEYDSPNNDDLDERFNDPNHLWQGWYMGVLSIIINEERFQEELASQGLAEPTTWDDLLDPAYKDVFVWANPTTAGGAYIATACQIFRLGEDAAWEYLKALDQNVHHYYQGAGDVISPVATGEFIASIAWAHDSFKTQQEGYPLKLIVPEQTAYEIGGAAIINGGPNTENAKIFMDWLLTKEAQELSVETSYRYPVRSDVAAPEGLPALDEVDLVDYDRDKATEMKESVLEKFEAEIMANRA